MYDEDEEEDFADAPSFEIMISEDEEVMVSSFVMEGQKIKFPDTIPPTFHQLWYWTQGKWVVIEI